MSKVKSPISKKKLSLKRDRRNAFGENPYASRKNIRGRKQRLHRGERRLTNQFLLSVGSETSEGRREKLQGKIEIGTQIRRVRGFKKSPDQPLGYVIQKKHAARIKKRMEAKFADSVVGRVQIWQLPLFLGQAWIEIDGQRVWSLGKGMGCLEDANQALSDYLSLSITNAVKSENPIIRAFATLDQRFSRRRLAQFDDSKEPPLVKVLYRFLCKAEGIKMKPEPLNPADGL